MDKYCIESRGILNDRELLYQCQTESMILPFEVEKISHVNEKKIISKGMSSYGYDVTLDNKFMYQDGPHVIVDPKSNQNIWKKIVVEEPYIIIQPGEVLLGVSKEKFRIPSNVLGLCFTKSTYARVGIQCLATPLEPGWEGFLTLEFVNNSKFPVKIYHSEGCCQIIFIAGEPPMLDYVAYGGKYQNQPSEPIASKV